MIGNRAAVDTAVDTAVGGAPGGPDLGVLRRLADAVRPTTLAVERTLPVADPLTGLFPAAALVRGSTVALRGAGATSLALALVAGPSRAGSWVGVVGWATVGWSAAVDYGVDPSRTVVVPEVRTGDWSTVGAALVDALDVVMVAPTHAVGATAARRLAARARERGAVLVVVEARGGWPQAPDVSLEVVEEGWSGVGQGHGHLRARRVSVRAGGRRAAGRPRDVDVWLPTTTGELARVEAAASSSRLRAV